MSSRMHGKCRTLARILRFCYSNFLSRVVLSKVDSKIMTWASKFSSFTGTVGIIQKSCTVVSPLTFRHALLATVQEFWRVPWIPILPGYWARNYWPRPTRYWEIPSSLEGILTFFVAKYFQTLHSKFHMKISGIAPCILTWKLFKFRKFNTKSRFNWFQGK